jgi:drug/metabolite transporter (DMT)-like permease
MKEKWFGLSKQTRGVLAGFASALFFTAYIIINRYVYNKFAANAIDYALLFTIATGLFAVLSVWRQGYWNAIKAVQRDPGWFFAHGVSGSAGVALLVLGQAHTSSINAALLVTGTILTTTVLSSVLLNESMATRQALWLGVLFIGLYIGIVGFRTFHLHLGDALIAGGVVLMGLGNVITRRLTKYHHAGIVPDIRLIFGAIVAAILSPVLFHGYEVLKLYWLYVFAAGFFAWLTMRAFAFSVKLINANQAVVLVNTQVIFTSLAGVVVLGEAYSLEKFVGAMVAMTSIYFITWKERVH